MRTTKTLRNTLSALAIAGISTAALGATAAAAQPAPASTSVLPCTSNQFTTKLVGGDAAMGNRYAALQITAKQGERCSLAGDANVDLVGAHNVLVSSDAPAHAPAVAISNGSSAYIPLHWTSIAGPSEQQTPNAISYSAPASSNPHGDPIDPEVTQAWNLGPVDTTAGSHTIDVGAIKAGTAPTGARG